MGIFNPGTGTGSHPRATAQRLEMVIGILGFFTLMALIQTVVREVRGEDAVGPAILLAVLVGVTGYAIHRRRSIRT
ncbi:MAG TPA: hypothetical protein VI452_17770 [Marmoricola sp.]